MRPLDPADLERERGWGQTVLRVTQERDDLQAALAAKERELEEVKALVRVERADYQARAEKAEREAEELRRELAELHGAYNMRAEAERDKRERAEAALRVIARESETDMDDFDLRDAQSVARHYFNEGRSE